MMEDDNIDLGINYGALNEEFGDVDISGKPFLFPSIL